MKINERKVSLRKCIFKERLLYIFLSFLVTNRKLLTAFFFVKAIQYNMVPYWQLVAAEAILKLVFRAWYVLSGKPVLPSC